MTLNNELQAIRVKEQQEIDRILTQLTALVAQYEEELLHIVTVLAEIDFMFTKAKYAHRLKASKPKINNEGKIVLLKAKHPLIPPEVVVANDIILGDSYTSIVITTKYGR